MSAAVIPPGGRVVSFIDIGTNSIRLLVVRINPNHSYTIVSRQKQQVRLGDGEFERDVILPEAMDRAVLVCRNFMELARAHASEEFVAVATSATREAANKNDLLNRLRHEAWLDVRVISGSEEARLIYMGVASGTDLGDRHAIFLDIGGGSTEIAVGGQQQYQYLASLKLGAIRLTNQYFGSGAAGPVPDGLYKTIQQQVRNALARDLQELRRLKFDCAIGSSGTIINLAEIASRTLHHNGSGREGELALRDLRKVAERLCALSLDARRRVPGMNPERADIIIAGSAILETIMKELRIEAIRITNRGLQDGLLADYLSRMAGFTLFGELSVRQRSVLQLGRSCGINEAHARTVTTLALELFDSALQLRLHAFGTAERELLEYATFLHDIGSFISYTNRHAHSWYIISNAELLGFNHREIAVMAAIARFYRKKPPRLKEVEIPGLTPKEKEPVLVLSVFLRLAESLDRSNAALVHHVRFSRADKNRILLQVTSRGDCQLELWDFEEEKKAFVRVFEKDLALELIKEDIQQNA